MYQRSASCVPAISIGLFAAILALDSSQLFAASDCIGVPHHWAAQGGHWYYHVNRDRRCWYTAAHYAAVAPQIETVPPPSQPDTAPPPFHSFSSFFSSIVSAFTPASTPQPDTLNPDAIAQPELLPNGDDGAPKRRRHAEAKRRYAEAKLQRRYEEAKHQPAPELKSKPSVSPDQTDLDAKPRPQPDPKSKPGVSPDQADLDALFQEYLRWQAWQTQR
jgi:hypothetical protein